MLMELSVVEQRFTIRHGVTNITRNRTVNHQVRPDRGVHESRFATFNPLRIGLPTHRLRRDADHLARWAAPPRLGPFGAATGSTGIRKGVPGGLQGRPRSALRPGAGHPPLRRAR